MGQTKAGKSSVSRFRHNVPCHEAIVTITNQLINRIHGSPVRRVGEEMISCTKELESVSIEDVPPVVQEALQGRRIVLLDTPGFDDTDVGDDEILIRIANWLETSYACPIAFNFKRRV